MIHKKILSLRDILKSGQGVMGRLQLGFGLGLALGILVQGCRSSGGVVPISGRSPLWATNRLLFPGNRPRSN